MPEPRLGAHTNLAIKGSVYTENSNSAVPARSPPKPDPGATAPSRRSKDQIARRAGWRSLGSSGDGSAVGLPADLAVVCEGRPVHADLEGDTRGSGVVRMDVRGVANDAALDSHSITADAASVARPRPWFCGRMTQATSASSTPLDRSTVAWT